MRRQYNEVLITRRKCLHAALVGVQGIIKHESTAITNQP